MATGHRSPPKQSRKSPRKRRGGSSSKRRGNESSYILDRSAGRHSLRAPDHEDGRGPYGMERRGPPRPPNYNRFADDYHRYRNDMGKEYHERYVRSRHREPPRGRGNGMSRREPRPSLARRSRPNKALNNNKRNRGSHTGGKNNSKNTTLQPIKVKQSGIMTAWKRSLGGLIRYYVHKRTETNQVDQQTAEEEIDQMYYRSGCSVEDTKGVILKALGVQDVDEWVSVEMAIVKDDIDGANVTSQGFVEAVDGKGLVLKQTVRPGEGPAHSTERWTTVVVPTWAIGKSYYFQVKNNTPLNLSCELFLDGEQVAFNAPLSANSTRTIRPDGVRYYQRHEWILDDAKRVKLGAVHNTMSDDNDDPQKLPVTPRYNGLRPDYQGKRISIQDYPDPTTYGWNFTGSVEASFVEFFEKKMNNGGLVKLDLYYTTGTVKTVLDHPTSGRNQLFRAQVTPEQYRAVLENPRAHTDQGYRRNIDRTDAKMKKEEVDDFDKVEDGDKMEAEADTDLESEGQDGDKVSAETKFYARDVNYDFQKQGHQNRQVEMNKLEKSKGYAEWKDANKKEYAVIHAKFYVSIPKRMHRAPPNKDNGGRRKPKQLEPLPVPEQAPVVDIKAAENCTLGTNYRTTGPAQTFGRSNVRMERINGLTDDKQWKGDPVFEKKLYYRAEAIINGGGLDDSGDEMSEDEDIANDILAVTLADYKTEKLLQVDKYHLDLSHSVPDEEEAAQLLRNVKNKIHLSSNVHDVDESVNLFYQDLIHRQFFDSDNYAI